MIFRMRIAPSALLSASFLLSAPHVQAAAAKGGFPKLIRRIMKADYEGDRGALDRFYGEADAFLGDAAVESRVRYWKAYTKWRRAMNGANETITPPDLADDSALCADEMQRAFRLDPAFYDAAIGEMQCLGLVVFFDGTREGNDERMTRMFGLAKELKQRAAGNPRYAWAWGMALFNVPADKGGGPDNVIKLYLEALDGIEAGAGKPKTPLDPAWGEAELYVNLAYSYFNRPDRDLTLAKHYVDEAVRRQPNWHYARDILRPQIETATQP